MTWVESDIYEVEVVWQDIEIEVPVRDDKELLRVWLSVNTKNTEGYIDDIELLRNLDREKLEGSEKIFMLVDEIPEGEEVELPVFGAINNSKIISFYIVPNEKILGSNSNYMTLKLRNKETGKDICTKTFLSEVNSEAYKVFNIGPIDEERAIIEETHSVTFVKENTGSGMKLPKSLLILEWDVV